MLESMPVARLAIEVYLQQTKWLSVAVKELCKRLTNTKQNYCGGQRQITLPQRNYLCPLKWQ